MIRPSGLCIDFRRIVYLSLQFELFYVLCMSLLNYLNRSLLLLDILGSGSSLDHYLPLECSPTQLPTRLSLSAKQPGSHSR